MYILCNSMLHIPDAKQQNSLFLRTIYSATATCTCIRKAFLLLMLHLMCRRYYVKVMSSLQDSGSVNDSFGTQENCQEKVWRSALD